MLFNNDIFNDGIFNEINIDTKISFCSAFLLYELFLQSFAFLI